MNKILEALLKLDPTNGDHWTADGLPRIDTVRMYAGNPGLSREDITKEAPDFSRQNPVLPGTANTTPVVTMAPKADEQASAPQTNDMPLIKQETQVEPPVENTLQTSLEGARVAMEDARQTVLAAEEKYREAQQRVDDIINEIHANGEGESTMDAVQAYLKCQQGVLNERARRVRVLQESGVTMADIQALIPQGAPIDSALRVKR